MEPRLCPRVRLCVVVLVVVVVVMVGLRVEGEDEMHEDMVPWVLVAAR
ncbi:hypothetical protein E2C01_052031 [Portunus trituberculatus]|uniref:Uncharacterized protein n=1 Tax=Portunus trituberculatus TaxID=210409 RepID=A0A5B7GKD3_PORTR|nr:hypothetical protein [Portunus trituberculatus]